MRPIRYCEKCGEYVDSQHVTRRGFTTKVALVHVDGDGNVIHRNHAPVEDTGQRKRVFPRLP